MISQLGLCPRVRAFLAAAQEPNRLPMCLGIPSGSLCVVNYDGIDQIGSDPSLVQKNMTDRLACFGL